jgi:hypothetical protein
MLQRVSLSRGLQLSLQRVWEVVSIVDTIRVTVSVGCEQWSYLRTLMAMGAQTPLDGAMIANLTV